jgi:hypothetical protein
VTGPPPPLPEFDPLLHAENNRTSTLVSSRPQQLCGFDIAECIAIAFVPGMEGSMQKWPIRSPFFSPNRDPDHTWRVPSPI